MLFCNVSSSYECEKTTDDLKVGEQVKEKVGKLIYRCLLSFDRSLQFKIGRSLALEALSKGNNQPNTHCQESERKEKKQRANLSIAFHRFPTAKFRSFSKATTNKQRSYLE
jgi:hypothetical protein